MGFVTVTTFMLICMVSLSACSRKLQQIDSEVVDVLQFGAIGDGKHDEADAFLAAWKAACGVDIGTIIFTIPLDKTFALSPVTFQGPCKASIINVQIMGKLVAVEMNTWSDKSLDRWLVFSNVNGLIVNGNGVIDGKGSDWWAKYQEDSSRPTALTFVGCDNLRLHSMTHVDSARNHISINECNGVIITNLDIKAPWDSPNTDGIDVSQSTGVTIYECIIATGDDCIAINGGTANVNISNIGCGPGHGISIGSLGENEKTDTVDEVHVRHITFVNTSNGARIKTWQGGKGYARRISFEDIMLIGVRNPIIIDQFYCDKPENSPCNTHSEAVRVDDVTFDGFRGTVVGDDMVQIKCSDTYGCSGIVLSNINVSFTNPTQDGSSSCSNAHGRNIGTINPNNLLSCLSS